MSKILQHNSIIAIGDGAKNLQASFDEPKRRMTHIVSTEDVNCYGYILRNQGMNQDEYRNNPVVLWAHELSGGFFEKSPSPTELIVGKNISLNVTDRGIEAVTEFADTALGNEVMQLNFTGFLSAWSVRWDFVEGEDKDLSFVNEVPIVINWKPKEYSSCVLPGNPFATNKLEQALSAVSTPIMKGYLHNRLVTAKINDEIRQVEQSLESKIDNIKPDSLTEKQVTDLRNELRSEIKRSTKDITERVLKLAYDMLTLKENLHSQILTSISNRLNQDINAAIRKYTGKLD